jgi:hypothetical protein
MKAAGAHPDPRWAIIVGGFDAEGQPFPMTFEKLAEIASAWEPLVERLPPELDGPARLLKMARSLFVHSWFDYEFMVVACVMALQAVEASLRLMYPTPENRPLKKLVDQAERENVLPSNIAEVARSGADLRNLFSHPATQAAITLGMATSLLENTHRLVAIVLAAASARVVAVQ